MPRVLPLKIRILGWLMDRHIGIGMRLGKLWRRWTTNYWEGLK